MYQEILNGNITDPLIIVDVLTEASDLYYNEGESFLSDSVFDTIEEILKKLDPNNIYFSKIGSNVRNGKEVLPFPMLGLEQVYENETEKWIKNNGWLNQQFVISDKEDGTSGLLIYGKNIFTSAYSRGNGYEGADITRHVSKMNIPKNVSQSLAIRVEFIIEDKTFTNMQNNWIKNNQRVYKNARNYVAGKMNASDNDQEFYDNVKVIATSIISPLMNKKDQFILLKKLGFDTPYYEVKTGYELNDGFLIPYLTERRKNSLTAIDGIVIDANEKTFQARKKYKVGEIDNFFLATVNDVIWKASKNGYLKPRVEFIPFNLNGITITYATGFNYKFIKENGIGKDAIVKVVRSGDVIPYIIEVIKPSEPILPDYDDTFLTENNVDIVLTNPEDCEEAVFNKLCAAFSQLNVPQLREGNIRKLYDNNITSIEDIIKLDKQSFINILGDSAGEKIFNGIKDVLNTIEFSLLASASNTLGRGFGHRKMKKITEILGDNYSTYTLEKVINIESFDVKTATILMDNLPKLDTFLLNIDGYYTIDNVKKVITNDFQDVSVCFTGIRNVELENKIISKGGKIASGVNSKTTHLVAKDINSNSGKNKKAKELNIPVISIQDAMKLWG